MKVSKVILFVLTTLLLLLTACKSPNMNRYKNGAKHGRWVLQVDSSCTIITNYFLGNKSGVEWRVFSSGEIHKIKYKKNILHGWSLFWDRHGNLYMKNLYIRGELRKTGWKSPDYLPPQQNKGVPPKQPTD